MCMVSVAAVHSAAMGVWMNGVFAYFYVSYNLMAFM